MTLGVCLCRPGQSSRADTAFSVAAVRVNVQVSNLFGTWAKKAMFAADPIRLVGKVVAVARDRLNKPAERSKPSLRRCEPTTGPLVDPIQSRGQLAPT